MRKPSPKQYKRPTLRFVPIKTEEHLDLQAVHRVRERWVMRRTAVVNQIRGLLLERGLTLPKGRSHVGGQLLQLCSLRETVQFSRDAKQLLTLTDQPTTTYWKEKAETL